MICIYFGKPRSGKTTCLSKIAVRNHFKKKIVSKFPFLRKFLKSYSVVYSTDPAIKFTTPISYKNLGKWCPEVGSCFLLCEAGIGLNNRAWKDLSSDAKELFAMHGHQACDIFADSQTVDIDISLRERAEMFYIIKKPSKRSRFSLMIPVNYNIDVNDQTAKVEECYKRARGLKLFFLILFGAVKIVYRPFYYKYFDSWRWDKKFMFPGPC